MPIEVPPDLDAALAQVPAARDAFWALPPERKDEWIAWIGRGRRAGRRRQRIAYAVRRLGTPAAVSTREQVVEEPVLLPPERSLWPWVLAALLLLAALAAFLIWWFGFRDDDGTRKNTVVTAQTAVPDVVGRSEADAVARVKRAKLSAVVRRAPSERAAGTVFGQSPSARTVVPTASKVTLRVSSGPAGVAVPSVTGLSAAEAVQKVSAAGLKARTSQVTSAKPPGTVVSQEPAGGRAKPGSTVALGVSRGAATTTVPNVVGQSRADASAAMTSAGFVPRIATVPSREARGTVVAQNPGAGQKAAKGSDVRLNVSNGAPAATAPTPTTTTTVTQTTTAPTTTTTTPTPSSRVQVPSLVGQKLVSALGALERAGLRSFVKYQSSQTPLGQVRGQNPAAGTTVARGSRVQVNVSEGPNPGNPTPVPDVRGQDQATATSTLEDAGFRVITITRTTGSGQSGRVVEQQPAAGTSIASGDFVAIYVFGR